MIPPNMSVKVRQATTPRPPAQQTSVYPIELTGQRSSTSPRLRLRGHHLLCGNFL